MSKHRTEPVVHIRGPLPSRWSYCGQADMTLEGDPPLDDATCVDCLRCALATAKHDTAKLRNDLKTVTVETAHAIRLAALDRAINSIQPMEAQHAIAASERIIYNTEPGVAPEVVPDPPGTHADLYAVAVTTLAQRFEIYLSGPSSTADITDVAADYFAPKP